ncbi:MAG: glycosyltransferase [Candidatus Roizmanbacteria bacterium]
MTAKPIFSIIIPTLNEMRRDNIETLLKSISLQKNKAYEIIVVDQSSDDGTVDIAKKYGAVIMNIPRPAFYTPPGVHRNTGAKAAHGDILIHLDADMELSDDGWLDRVASLIDEEHQAAIIHEKDIAYGYWNKCKALERRCYWGTPMESARIVSCKLFEQVGGYDQHISSGEDFHISELYGRHTSINQSDEVWLKHRTGSTSLGALLRKKYSYGKTANVFLRASPSRLNIAKESLVAYLKHSSLLIRQPHIACGMLVLRILEFVAVKYGMKTVKTNI